MLESASLRAGREDEAIEMFRSSTTRGDRPPPRLLVGGFGIGGTWDKERNLSVDPNCRNKPDHKMIVVAEERQDEKYLMFHCLSGHSP